MHNLPLYLETVRDFEAEIVNCSRHLPREISDVPVPLYERYYDSKLPVVSQALVARCPGTVEELRSHFMDRRRFKHEVVPDEDVSFKSLTSNVSDVVRALDDLRKAPTKFICINDDQVGPSKYGVMAIGIIEGHKLRPFKTTQKLDTCNFNFKISAGPEP